MSEHSDRKITFDGEYDSIERHAPGDFSLVLGQISIDLSVVPLHVYKQLLLSESSVSPTQAPPGYQYVHDVTELDLWGYPAVRRLIMLVAAESGAISMRGDRFIGRQDNGCVFIRAESDREYDGSVIDQLIDSIHIRA